MKDIEIEIQTRIEHTDKLIDFLVKNAKFTGDNYQKDEYYTPKHRNFLEVSPVAEWLRIRESSKNSFTYKKWHYDKNGRSRYNDEYESVVENIDQLRKVFLALDFSLLATVEKKRRTWRYKDYEIALDHITDLGDFVEVEYKANKLKDKPENITNAMVQFLKDCGAGRVERNYVGYPFMLLFPNKVVFEEV